MRSHNPEGHEMPALTKVGTAPRTLDPTSEDPIDFILSHPAMSQWLKDALIAAGDRQPNDVLNDLEILSHVFRDKAHRLTARSKHCGAVT